MYGSGMMAFSPEDYLEDYEEEFPEKFLFDEEWETHDGTKVRFEDMELTHAKNLYMWFVKRGYYVPYLLMYRLFAKEEK